MGLSSLNNNGPHGLTEILYAYTSATGNNGSAFAGLNANTHWYNVSLGFTMLIGRFLMMVPVLALAGNLAQKKSVPPSPGTFPVNTTLFTVLLDWRDPDPRRAHLLPGVEPRPHSGTPLAARRSTLLSQEKDNDRKEKSLEHCNPSPGRRSIR